MDVSETLIMTMNQQRTGCVAHLTLMTTTVHDWGAVTTDVCTLILQGELYRRTVSEEEFPLKQFFLLLAARLGLRTF